jgi:sialate O-acetylesterase
MELPVWRSLEAATELSNATAPTIRLLTVPQLASPVPLATFSTATHWQTVDAATLRDFSAACFYFARELQKSVDVPMGLINASWGGARIQAWIDAGALKSDSRYRESLEVLNLYEKDPLAAAKRWGEVWGTWWGTRSGTTAGDKPWSPLDKSVTNWRKAPAELGPWERWHQPALADFNGMVWFRTVIKLTPDQARQDAVLELGALDETDITWVNGQAVGGNYDPGSPRHYPLPPGLLKEGENKIVINVLDTYREGGMSAPASAYRLLFRDGSSAPLENWEYRMAAEGQAPPSAPWQSAGGVSTLHN